MAVNDNREHNDTATYFHTLRDLFFFNYVFWLKLRNKFVPDGLGLKKTLT